MTLGQSFDCPSVSEATLKNMGKIDLYQTTTKLDKVQNVHIITEMHCAVGPL